MNEAFQKLSSSGASSQSSSSAPPWDTILELCRSKLGPQDFAVVCQFGSVEELVQYGSELQEKYKQSTKSYNFVCLSSFFERLRAFHSSLDMIAHTQPTVLAPLWGSLRLCVDLLHETEEVFEMIVRNFQEITETLPRIWVYVEVLGQPKSLVQPCQEVHLLIAEFACLVIIYFRKHPFKNLLLATWMPYKGEITSIISRIQRKTKEIELLVKMMSLQSSVRKDEEIRQKLSAIDLKSRETLPCHFVPYSRHPWFVGREKELSAMEKHFSGPMQRQLCVALHGLGGMGKTQICLEYVFRHIDKYDAVFWISADDTIKMGQDVRNALVKLGLLNQTSTSTDQQCLTTFTNWLLETEVSWLLLLDNADDLKILKEIWPNCSHGNIIISSRDPSAARYPSFNNSMKGIKLLPLPDLAGADLILSILRNSNADGDDNGEDDDDNDEFILVPHRDMGRHIDNRALSQKLAQQLGGLPLAIVQIANYMIEVRCDFQEVLEIYSDFRHRHTLLRQSLGDHQARQIRPLATVWEMSIRRIAEANQDSIHLLQLLTMFDCDGVPESLLDGNDVQRNSLDLTGLRYLRNKVDLLNTIRPLLQQSMVSKNKYRRDISMHRLVATMTQDRMTATDHQSRFDEAVELLYRVYPQVTVAKVGLNDQWPRCQLYLPQVMAVERCYRESSDSLLPRAHFATVLANACWFLFERGLIAQAMSILPSACSIGDATLGNDDLSLATIYRSLGGIQLDFGKPEDALTSFTKALDIQRNISDVISAHGYTAVALTYLCLGQYEPAKQNIEIAQEIRARYPDQSEGYKALTLDVYGMLESLRGEYNTSIKYIKEAITLYDDDQGVGNYLTAFANFTLGNVHLQIGQLDDAYNYHALSLAVRQDSLGETYRTAASLHKVAWHSHIRGNYEDAERLLLKALAIYENSYGSEGAVGRSSYLMSMVLSALNREDDACHTKALAARIRQKLLGIPADQDDSLESYDRLVSYQDR